MRHPDWFQVGPGRDGPITVTCQVCDFPYRTVVEFDDEPTVAEIAEAVEMHEQHQVMHPRALMVLVDDEPSRCPACGDVIDCCQGHGELGDPAGHEILRRHDEDDHTRCHPEGCEAADA